MMLQKTAMAELKEKHKVQKMQLAEARYKEEAFLKKCIQDADDELDEEKKQHQLKIKRIQELEVSGGIIFDPLTTVKVVFPGGIGVPQWQKFCPPHQPNAVPAF